VDVLGCAGFLRARAGGTSFESQRVKASAGALDRLAAITGQPAETIALPPPVKPVDGPDGPASLDAAIGEHQPHTDVHALMGRVPFRDDRVAGLDWQATAPAASGAGDRILGCPDAGMRWLARRRLRGRGAGAVRDPGQPSAGRDRAVGPRRRHLCRSRAGVRLPRRCSFLFPRSRLMELFANMALYAFVVCQPNSSSRPRSAPRRAYLRRHPRCLRFLSGR
jgi:hypothetical protein